MPNPERSRLVVVPSNEIVQQSMAAKQSDASGSYTKLKEIVCTAPGTYRFKFLLRQVTGGSAANAQIYRNGSAVGVERTATDTVNFVAQVEDIGLWKAGELMQLYGKALAGFKVEVAGFQVFGEWDLKMPAIPAGAVNLA